MLYDKGLREEMGGKKEETLLQQEQVAFQLPGWVGGV